MILYFIIKTTQIYNFCLSKLNFKYKTVTAAAYVLQPKDNVANLIAYSKTHNNYGLLPNEANQQSSFFQNFTRTQPDPTERYIDNAPIFKGKDALYAISVDRANNPTFVNKMYYIHSPQPSHNKLFNPHSVTINLKKKELDADLNYLEEHFIKIFEIMHKRDLFYDLQLGEPFIKNLTLIAPTDAIFSIEIKQEIIEFQDRFILFQKKMLFFGYDIPYIEFNMQGMRILENSKLKLSKFPFKDHIYIDPKSEKSYVLPHKAVTPAIETPEYLSIYKEELYIVSLMQNLFKKGNNFIIPTKPDWAYIESLLYTLNILKVKTYENEGYYVSDFFYTLQGSICPHRFKQKSVDLHTLINDLKNHFYVYDLTKDPARINAEFEFWGLPLINPTQNNNYFVFKNNIARLRLFAHNVSEPYVEYELVRDIIKDTNMTANFYSQHSLLFSLTSSSIVHLLHYGFMRGYIFGWTYIFHNPSWYKEWQKKNVSDDKFDIFIFPAVVAFYIVIYVVTIAAYFHII